MISKLCQVTIISKVRAIRVGILKNKMATLARVEPSWGGQFVFQNAHLRLFFSFFSCDIHVEYIMVMFSKIKNCIMFTPHNAFGVGEFKKKMYHGDFF